MDQAEGHVQNRSDTVAEAIAATKKATELREAAIKELLAQRDQIERDLKILGFVPPPNGDSAAPLALTGNSAEANPSKRFEDLPLAAVVEILLSEHGKLHGKEIETRAKSGGFYSASEDFQNYLPVALRRAGGFRNAGGNTWVLDEGVPPKR